MKKRKISTKGEDNCLCVQCSLTPVFAFAGAGAGASTSPIISLGKNLH